MSEKKYKLICDKDNYVVMENSLVKGQQDMTLQEAKLLRLLITQAVKEDVNLKAYTITIVELSVFLQVAPNNLYRDIRLICDNLTQRVVRLGTNNPKNPWLTFPWMEFSSYDGAGNITLKLNQSIKPYVLELEKYYTQYQLKNILVLNSFYAIRLYELLKTDEYRGTEYLEYSVSFLREFFDCKDNYTRISDFKRYVIERAEQEITRNTDLKISKIEYIKKGRFINKIRFYLFVPGYYKSRRSGAIQQLKQSTKRGVE